MAHRPNNRQSGGQRRRGGRGRQRQNNDQEATVLHLLPAIEKFQLPWTDDDGVTGHSGLYYEKYGEPWSWAKKPDEDLKKDWMRRASKAGNDPCKAATDRMKKRIEAAHGRARAMCFDFKLCEPLAVGLGIGGPLDIGCLWHPTIGLPYLPGSGLKGLMRTWASEWVGADEDEIAHLLGPAEIERETDGFTGSLIIHDALPMPGLELQVDTITPHYSDYHGGNDAAPLKADETDEERDTRENGEVANSVWPGDWESPKIIPFLSVKRGADFRFGLGLRPGADRNDLCTGIGWLQQGLEFLGAGARTSRGYGRIDV